MLPSILIQGVRSDYQARLSFDLAFSLFNSLPDRSMVKSSALDDFPCSARWARAEGSEEWHIVVKWENPEPI